MSAITDFWLETYRRKRGVSYKFQRRDGIILANLSKLYGEKELRWIIFHYLQIEDEPFLERCGWDTRALERRAMGLHVKYGKAYGEREVEEANRKREALKQLEKGPMLTLLNRIGRPVK